LRKGAKMNHKYVSLKFIFITFIIVIFCFTLLQSGSQVKPEEIIDKAITAQGGRAALESIKDKTIKSTTKMYTPQQNFLTITVAYIKYNPLKIRAEQIIQGMRVITGYDGNNIWLDSMGQVMIAPPIIANPLKALIVRENLLLGYKEKECSIQYLGESEVSSNACYQIKFTDKDNNETIYYFNAQTYLPIKIEYSVINQIGAVAKYEILLSDYRSVENIVIPFKTDTFINSIKKSESTITEIQFNQDLDSILFEMPESK
jgi:outer membrane lipoprotein-sorting protein